MLKQIAVAVNVNDGNSLTYAKNFNPIILKERIITYTRHKAFRNNVLIVYLSMKNKINKRYKCNTQMKRNITNKKKCLK